MADYGPFARFARDQPEVLNMRKGRGYPIIRHGQNIFTLKQIMSAYHKGPRKTVRSLDGIFSTP
jgi:hypothetical protein